MSRIIDLTEEREKHLMAIIDSAMKFSGAQVLASIDIVRAGVKDLPKEPGQQQ